MEGTIRLGKTVFRPFEKNDGAYVNADAGGHDLGWIQQAAVHRPGCLLDARP